MEFNTLLSWVPMGLMVVAFYAVIRLVVRLVRRIPPAS